MNNESLFYSKLKNDVVQCVLCPHNCKLDDNEAGICGVRINYKGTLYNDNYGLITGSALDPIEKKPLYHFYPGAKIYSIGSVGCNFHCKFCQNFHISQTTVKNLFTKRITPQNIIDQIKDIKENIGIAYTYNEPTVSYEFMMETAILAQNKGLKNVVVSNGYINPKPLEKLIDIVDGFNIDFKSYSNDFYREITHGSLIPVLKTIKHISSKNKHIELTFLVIPNLNDSEAEFKEMLKWIKNETDESTVLHISRYFPHFHIDSPPTSINKMTEFFEIASNELQYVYLGNVGGRGQNTICPRCNETVIFRNGYDIDNTRLKDGICSECGHEILKFF